LLALPGQAGKQKTGHVRQVVVLFIAAACALAQLPARAQPMNDPMRPPGATVAGEQAPTSAGLQAVVISTRRKVALIDGAVVPVGGPVRDGTLAGVSDSLAVLKKNGERDVLLMHPNIDKKPARRDGAR
jgi:MSHA biogenesis protein MshK